MKSGRERARRKDREQAVEVSSTGPEGNQTEHIQAAVDDRRPSAFEEWPSRPKDDGRGQSELNPSGDVLLDKIMQTQERNVASHFKHEDRQR